MTSERGLRELMKRGSIRRCPADHRAAANLIYRASTDLRTAERNLDVDPECAFTYSYTAMMRSGLALMFSRGYRPVAGNKHQTIVQFVLRIPRDSGRVFRRKAATIPSEAGHCFRRESGHFLAVCRKGGRDGSENYGVRLGNLGKTGYLSPSDILGRRRRCRPRGYRCERSKTSCD